MPTGIPLSVCIRILYSEKKIYANIT